MAIAPPLAAVKARPAKSDGTAAAGHLPALDGLRGCSCLAVILFHLFRPYNLCRGGFLGVDLFFVLSGFLITSLLVKECQLTGTISLKHFYLRRALRLLPAFLLLLALCWGYSWTFAAVEEAANLRRSVLVALFYLSNRPDVSHLGIAGPLAHTWSLSVEEQFYLLWPLALGVLLWEKVSRRWILLLTAGGIAASAGLRAVWFKDPVTGPLLYFGLETRADALLTGCLVGLLAAWDLLPKSRWAHAVLRLAALLSVGLLVYLILTALPWEPRLYKGLFTLVAAAAGCVIASLVVSPPRLLRMALEFPPLIWVGRLSYGLYLWHWPILVLITKDHSALLDHGTLLGGLGQSHTAVVLMIVGLSFLVAAVSFYGIERPFLRLKGRFTEGGAPAAPTASEEVPALRLAQVA
jgi:peptidoglycan/LPS O-acetylase OafA/YrhL